MAKGSASSPTATPPQAALKRTTSSTQNMKNQKSILGFFQKSSPATPSNDKPREPASSPAQRAGEKRGASAVKPTPKRNFSSFAQDLTPVPSSDLPIPEEDEKNGDKVKVRLILLLFPTSSLANVCSPFQSGRDEIQDTTMSPSRRVCQLHIALAYNNQKLIVFRPGQEEAGQLQGNRFGGRGRRRGYLPPQSQEQCQWTRHQAQKDFS